MALRPDPVMRKVSSVFDLRQMKALADSFACRLRSRLPLRRGQWLRLAFLTGVLFFFLVLLLAPGSSSSVYANQQAPAAAQEAGLPAPPMDASGQPLPPVGTTVPQADLSANASQAGLNSLAVPLSLECNGTNSYTTAQDGNPYPICPGPMPTNGGNCTWWAWEMWHRLGYNLPHWGDAATWIGFAQKYGLQLGTEPRVNALVIFPVGDGVWAFTSAGHVAFVTNVYSDLDTFDVSYQNYGDPAVVHYGLRYRASLIQQPRYQNGQMRFIYFPGTGGAPPGTESGSGSGSSQQVINNYVGKFSGDGHSEILRYNRTAGTLDLLELSDDLSTLSVVPLEDSTTQQGHWGSSWEVYIGDFSGKGSDDLLLYDRKHGVARFLTFYSDLTINTDVVQTGWKSSWEIYVGNFDGSHDQLLFYDRNTSQDHGQFTPAPGEPTVPTGTTGQGQSPGGTGNGSSSPPDWEHSHRTATLALLDYNADFTVRRQVNFDRWQNTWEVHIGHYGQVGRDGILFYDRAQGELRVVVFNNNLAMKATYQQHKVPGGLEVYSGDFDGSLQDSLFLFNRSAGTAQLIAFQPDLTVRRQVNYTDWGKTWEFYTGHFGGPSSAAVSFLLYSRNTGVLSFIGFGSDLTVARQERYQGIRSNWEVFVGQFSACGSSSGDADATATTTPTTPTPTATPTDTATPDPNNDDAPPAPGSGNTVTVTQSCGDSVLLVDENTGQGQLITFSFDNGLQGGQSLFTQTPVPWITPTPTNTPTATKTPKPKPPTATPTTQPTSGSAPAPSPTNSPTPPTNSPTPTPTDTQTPTPTPTDTQTPTPTP